MTRFLNVIKDRFIITVIKFTALILVSIVSASAFGYENNHEGNVTLEGILKVHPKYLYKYYITGFGDGQECALMKCQELEKFKPGSYIHVEGKLGTFYHSGGNKNNPSPLPKTWVIYMDVEKVYLLEPTQEQASQESTIRKEPKIFDLFVFGELGGKYLNEIIKKDDITQIIILEDNTSAPVELHVSTIYSTLKSNPKINSFYSIDPNTGNRIRSFKDEVNGFFTALVKTRNEKYLGLEISRTKIRIFNDTGDGFINRTDREQTTKN